MYPKKLWPPVELCAECHAPEGGSSRWNEAEVLRFLQHFYQVTRPRSSGSRKHLGALDGENLATNRWRHACQHGACRCIVYLTSHEAGMALIEHAVDLPRCIAYYERQSCPSGGCGLEHRAASVAGVLAAAGAACLVCWSVRCSARRRSPAW